MGKLFDHPYAPSTLGSFCARSPSVTLRQRDAVASRLLTGLSERSGLLPGLDGMVLVDVDDSIAEVHGHAKQGAGFGYTRVRRLYMLLADREGRPVPTYRLSSPDGCTELLEADICRVEGIH